jgi:hypothetical protein
MRPLQDVGGTLGEIFYVDADGILVPIDVSAIADGDVPIWDDTLGVWTVGPMVGGDTVSNDVKDVWTLLPIGDAQNSIPTGLWPAPAYLPPGEIQEASLFGKEASGSIVLDLWADVPANWPPTIGDTIVASAKPTITTAQSAVNVSRTGWTNTTGSVGKMFYAYVESVTNFTLVTLWVRTRRA